MDDRSGRPYFTTADAELTRRIGIINLHDDFPIAIAKRRFDGVYDSLRTYWLPQFRAGGVGAVVAAIFTPSVYVPEGALRHALWLLDGLLTEIDENHDDIALAFSSTDVRRLNAEGKVAVLLAVEGAEPLGNDLAVLRLLHRLGLRMLSVTWARRTAFGVGNWEHDAPGGLTRLGVRAVEEMNRLGIIVDVSHASDRTTADILAASTKPVIASHANARALRDHPRNLTDEVIRAIAARGGVVGAVAVADFIDAGEPSIAKWVDHLEHLIEIAGIDHVAIGADFYRHQREINAAQGIAEADGAPFPGTARFVFPGMENSEDLPGLTAELARRGMGEEDLRKIYRDNFLRVMSAVVDERGGRAALDRAPGVH
ncbi:MAG TPA: membrane dipeptidase [bacterium]|nr:membrane dipeptidase [bacterium]